MSWIPVAWVAESMLAILCGFYWRNVLLRNAAWWVFWSAWAVFILLDGVRDIKFAERYFIYKYTVVTLATIIVMRIYITMSGKTALSEALLRFLIRFTIVNSWLYVLRTGDELYFVSMSRGYYFEFYRVALSLLTNAVFAYGLYDRSLCRDRIIWAIRSVQFAGAVFQSIWLDIYSPVPNFAARPAVGYANIMMACAVLLLLYACLFITGKKMLKDYRDKTTLS